MNIAQEFKAARLNADLSIKEAATIIDRSISTVNRLERSEKISDRLKAQAQFFMNKINEVDMN